MGTTTQNLGKLGYRYDVLGTFPRVTAGNEAMVARGYVRGRGTAFRFSGQIIGKTLKVLDTHSTTTTEKTVTFTRSMFGDATQPTLAEIVAAINAAWAEATPTVASAGADGRLVITGGAAHAAAELTIGKGTANLLLGFPHDDLTVKYDNGVGVDLILPPQFGGAGWGAEFLHMNAPRVECYTYTPATGVHVQVADFTATWTPGSRTLRLAQDEGARQFHAVIEF